MKYELKPEAVLTAKIILNKSDRNTTTKTRILVKMKSAEDKSDILKTCKKVKPQNLYVNENLTRERSKILAALRKAKHKKPEVIDGCNSRVESVVVWIKNSDPTSRNTRVYVNNWSKLEKFCEDTLQLNADELLQMWLFVLFHHLSAVTTHFTERTVENFISDEYMIVMSVFVIGAHEREIYLQQTYTYRHVYGDVHDDLCSEMGSI